MAFLTASEFDGEFHRRGKCSAKSGPLPEIRTRNILGLSQAPLPIGPGADGASPRTRTESHQILSLIALPVSAARRLVPAREFESPHTIPSRLPLCQFAHAGVGPSPEGRTQKHQILNLEALPICPGRDVPIQFLADPEGFEPSAHVSGQLLSGEPP